MRRFYLRRDREGEAKSFEIVAQGVEFNDTLVDSDAKNGKGKVVVHWFVEPRSIIVWDSIQDLVLAVARDDKTTITWMD